MHRPRLDAEEEGVESRDHEPLDVVRIAVGQGLVDRVAQTGHLGIAGPVEARERFLRLERVPLSIGRHEEPVEPADIFAPPEDLPDESLGAGEGGAAGAVGLLCGGDRSPRVEELEVERCRDPRVVEPGFAGPHRVLILPEGREAVRDEVVECGGGLRWRDGPVEGVEPTWV